MIVLKIQSALNQLCVALEQNGWSKETIVMWRNNGQNRAMNFVLGHKNKEVALHVLEEKIQNICALLDKDVLNHRIRYGVNMNNNMLQLPVHLLLIPSYFIQQCEKDVQQLAKWSAL